MPNEIGDQVTRKKVIENHKNGINTPGFIVFYNKELDQYLVRKERAQTPKTQNDDWKTAPKKQESDKKVKLSKVLFHDFFTKHYA